MNAAEVDPATMQKLATLFRPPVAIAKPFDPRSIAVRHSNLKTMGRSAAHYLYHAEHGIDDTAAMRLGRAVHLLLLGGLAQLKIFDGASRRSKAWEAFKELHPIARDGEGGFEVLLASELETAEAMAASVRRHPHAMQLLKGQHELKLEWVRAGRKCSARLDVAGEDFVTDVKSSVNVSPAKFKKTARDLGYYSQLAWYMEGANKVLAPRTFARAFIVAVESTPPFVVQPYEVTARGLDFGTRTASVWFEQLLVCEASGLWPGYLDGVGSLDMEAEGEELDDLIEISEEAEVGQELHDGN
jgi:hypothetical protein